MGLKGMAYPKTTWDYQEKPVASAKLNRWDDRIEAALELAFKVLSLAWGGGDGVLRGAWGELAVAAAATPGMSVTVARGYAFISGAPYRLAEAAETPAVDAPVSQPRVDLVQARLATWDVSVVTGTEAAAPVAPAAETDGVALAELYLRPGMAVILDTDDGVNGYISDVRSFL
jgi:hypothetical protein